MGYVTPLSAYLDQRAANEKESLGNIQQAGSLQAMLAQAGAQQREAKAREIMASNASPEDKFAALAAVSPQHAQQFATGLKEMATMKAVSGLRNLTPDQLQDPDTLERLGASGLPGTAHFTVAAQRLRDQKATADLAGTMRSRPEIQPDPQEVAQAADDASGQKTPAPQTVPAQIGEFGTLMESKDASIARSAKNLQAQFDALKNPTAQQVARFEAYRKELTARQDTYDQQEKMLKLREDNKSPLSEIGKLRADLNAGRITKAEFDAASVKKLGDPNAVFDKGAIEEAAARYKIDGTLPPNIGRGTQGPVNIARILKRSAEMSAEAGDSAEAARIGQIANKATSAALVDLTKREGQIGAFEKTFVSNTQLVEKLSAAVDRDTNMPLVDKWIQSGKKATGPNPKLRSLDTAIKGAVNEYTKIVSGTMGNTALAEGEIKKIEGLLSSAQTKEDVLAVIKTMRIETQNRMRGFKDQKAELIGNMRETPSPAAAEPPPVTPAPVPASLTPAEQKELETLRKRFGR